MTFTKGNTLYKRHAAEYVPAQPVRDHLAALKGATGSWQRIADASGITHGTLLSIRDGRHRHTRKDIADKLLALHPEDFDPPEADLEVLRRILAGEPFTIPWGEKRLYAVELYEEYRWNPSRIASVLHMGWRQTKEVLDL